MEGRSGVFIFFGKHIASLPTGNDFENRFALYLVDGHTCSRLSINRHYGTGVYWGLLPRGLREFGMACVKLGITVVCELCAVAAAVIDYRNSQQNAWLDKNLETVCDMTLEEYNTLSKEDRYKVDIKLLNNRSEDITTANDDLTGAENIETSSEESTQNYGAEIEASVISQYEFNSAKLSDEQMDSLHKIGGYMKEDNSISVKIIGHTCSVGSARNNYNVGLKRAEEAKKYLVEQGVNAERIHTESAGYSNPITSNDTADGRKMNRRITFKIVH